MAIIRKVFEIPIPDKFLHDDIVTPSTQDWEYIGDDIIWVYVDKETGKPSVNTITDEQKNDGRPVPLDKYLIKIDANKEPLIASLLCGPGKVDTEFETNRPTDSILVDEVDGYGEYVILAKYHVWEIFNLDSIRYNFDTSRWHYEVLHYTDILNVEELTWDMLRQKRDHALKGTDGRESGDMPQKMIDELRDYRQKLREYPNVMEGKDPWIAYNLFPKQPSWF